ncbi:MAG TPA: xanthine dehydrogenase family protein molybdopterin-binding subunit [Kofleriaceae bacterium]|nr:xanthine dehydrogenase family protein molybdopterin-binding subunit [Kofleriaceae bacterium]
MIGQPIDRVDAPLKVSGRAPYSYETQELAPPLQGFIVGAPIGRGRITRIDATRARRAPGVRLVMTYLDAPPQAAPDLAVPSAYDRAQPVLHGPEVHAYGEPVALVVADTLEEARAAAAQVDVVYDVAVGRFDLAARESKSFVPERVNAGMAVDTRTGDFDTAFAGAPVALDLRYTTPYELSQPLEPHGCVAVWSGDTVTVHLSTQIVASARAAIAATLQIAPERVNIRAPFVGGGFGSKLGIHAEVILAVLAARQLGLPVKVVQTRQQTFQLVGHRPASIQRVRLGADRDGRLIAFGHDVTMQVADGSDYIEQTATVGRGLYAAPHRLTRHRGVVLDLGRGEDVRAPGEAPGLLAVESAMDELAHALGRDPVALRIANEPDRHPESGLPFSGRRLVECMEDGARRFGWDRRPTTPGSVFDGDWLVGYGMAAAIRPHFQSATAARVRVRPDGTAVVESDMTDIGTGTYTILAQVAAETLGLPLDRVRVALGDSAYPASGGSGGSWGATNSTSAVYAACRALIERLGARADALLDRVARDFPDGVEATGAIPDQADEPAYQQYVLNTYGAHFAEVHVHATTGEIRVRRMLGVFACGRIFNRKTARSQLVGGMLWGLSAALLEDAQVEPRTGGFVQQDFAGYLVPVHADIPAIDAIMLDDVDDKANALGAKGLGELGICGAGAAIANAVFNATGIRVRDFPITIEKILPGLARLF